MSQTCTVSIICVLIGWTASTSQSAKRQDHAWVMAVLVFVTLSLYNSNIYQTS